MGLLEVGDILRISKRPQQGEVLGHPCAVHRPTPPPRCRSSAGTRCVTHLMKTMQTK